jgi:hypothetical protein
MRFNLPIELLLHQISLLGFLRPVRIRLPLVAIAQINGPLDDLHNKQAVIRLMLGLLSESLLGSLNAWKRRALGTTSIWKLD